MAQRSTAARMARLVAQWRASDESGAIFARRHGVRPWTSIRSNARAPTATRTPGVRSAAARRSRCSPGRHGASGTRAHGASEIPAGRRHPLSHQSGGGAAALCRGRPPGHRQQPRRKPTARRRGRPQELALGRQPGGRPARRAPLFIGPELQTRPRPALRLSCSAWPHIRTHASA